MDPTLWCRFVLLILLATYSLANDPISQDKHKRSKQSNPIPLFWKSESSLVNKRCKRAVLKSMVPVFTAPVAITPLKRSKAPTHVLYEAWKMDNSLMESYGEKNSLTLMSMLDILNNTQTLAESFTGDAKVILDNMMELETKCVQTQLALLFQDLVVLNLRRVLTWARPLKSQLSYRNLDNSLCPQRLSAPHPIFSLFINRTASYLNKWQASATTANIENWLTLHDLELFYKDLVRDLMVLESNFEKNGAVFNRLYTMLSSPNSTQSVKATQCLDNELKYLFLESIEAAYSLYNLIQIPDYFKGRFENNVYEHDEKAKFGGKLQEWKDVKNKKFNINDQMYGLGTSDGGKYFNWFS